MLGLDLDSYVDYASDCTDSGILVLDQFIYLLNNITIRTAFFDPIINFTGLLDDSASELSLFCFQFGYSFFSQSVVYF